ncbi:7SK snRNA methylphosphate capping enzyme isoform X2 [Lampris incognitus]|uniref:7SK snRNA methylphosphate capping enzyme isoform X2 n=1 Tax=Lampris incognitus TaxID=2546036 RepID=UPI0024B4FD73|nr:7SK snRNA methylphosphate capping enzyme isoform X2 [Lampris incognitus]
MRSFQKLLLSLVSLVPLAAEPGATPHQRKMIKMSLDKEPALPCDRTLQEVPIKVSPVLPASVSLSDQPKRAKTHPLRQKNGIRPSANDQAPPTAPTQRIAKRRYSMGVGFKGLAKRRRRVNSDSLSEPVLPTNFLLGGNIFDPLNLNSLLDEEVNRATNQETPKSSPLPVRGGDPVEILVPRDITDPLNLKGGGEEAGAGRLLLSPQKSRRRHRNRHHGGAAGAEVGERGKTEGGGEREVNPAQLFSSKGPTVAVPVLTRERSIPPSPLPCELNTAITCREDLAQPPILPRRHTHPPTSHTHKPRNQRDGRQKRRRHTTSTRSSDGADISVAVILPTRFQTPLVGGTNASSCGGLQANAAQASAKNKKDKRRYQYGNHSHYYGYHGFYGDRYEGLIGSREDPRLCLLKANWFRDKEVLDIGCGVGHLTLVIARRFCPAKIVGVDRDERLVHAARQNIRHLLSHDLVLRERGRGREKRGETDTSVKDEPRETRGEREEEVMEEVERALSSVTSFPLSFRLCHGPLSAPPLTHQATGFPNNITFISGDYVSEQEAWPGQGLYDVIMCLGVTKWVQLQSGDAGVVRLFKRVYQSLSPGGLFILEAQPWSSYGRGRRATEVTFQNYRNLRLRPENFTSHLTDNTGFQSYRLLTHTGDQRPIYLFHKGSVPRK